MNHLIKFEVFEASTTTRIQTPKSQYLPKLGSVDPKKIAAINGRKDVSISPEDKIRISNDSKNWFEKIGAGIEKLGGSYIKDPMKWRDDYKSTLPKNSSGDPIDSGFSDIMGWGGAAVKGIAGKVFGSSKEKYVEPSAEFGTTPEHHRVYLDNLQKKTPDAFKDPSKYEEFAAKEYRRTGRYPGQVPAFDDIMLAGKYRADAATSTLAAEEAALAASSGTASAFAGAAEMAPIVARVGPLVI